ncbi:hypothetical protein LPU83_pLPU83b_0352 (plasmid) [Rhizobium favelukesii]|uniref:Uncharacterized protein n=1 Tax=Rhizobium favelukesii TaxID=348824 RepID=W6RHQ5_9HYPH|nr:hypothetical protein LPU83_pLPU83b_0352 [Rhizobium favelukesii]
MAPKKLEMGSTPVACFLEMACWPRLKRRGLFRISIPAGAGPNQLVTVLAFDFRQRCVDGSGEARVIELDREIIAVALARVLLPGGAEFDVMRCTA